MSYEPDKEAIFVFHISVAKAGYVNAQLSKVIFCHLFSATYFTFASPEDITIRAVNTANTTAGTKLFFLESLSVRTLGLNGAFVKIR